VCLFTPRTQQVSNCKSASTNSKAIISSDRWEDNICIIVVTAWKQDLGGLIVSYLEQSGPRSIAGVRKDWRWNGDRMGRTEKYRLSSQDPEKPKCGRQSRLKRKINARRRV